MAQLFHVGLTVKNLERSLAFYRDVAEMTEEEHLEVRSKAFDTLTNNPGAALKVAHLTAGTFMLQLTSGLVQIAPTMRSFYTEDPDGLPVEFLQLTR